MKLDLDCVREVLLEVEKLPFDDELRIEELYKALPKYDQDVVHYNVLKMIETDLLDGTCIERDDWRLPHVFFIYDITFTWHQLLAKVRDENRWGTVKKGLAAVRDYSLSAIGAIAEGVTSAAINAYISEKV